MTGGLLVTGGGVVVKNGGVLATPEGGCAECCDGGGGPDCCEIPPWEPGSCYGSPECLPSAEGSGCCSNPANGPCTGLVGPATVIASNIMYRYMSPPGGTQRRYVGPETLTLNGTVSNCGTAVASASGPDWWETQLDPNPPNYHFCEIRMTWQRGSASGGPRIFLTINPDGYTSLLFRWIDGVGSCLGPSFQQSCGVQVFGACNSAIDGTYTAAVGPVVITGSGRAMVTSGIGYCPGAAPLAATDPNVRAAIRRQAGPCVGCGDADIDALLGG